MFNSIFETLNLLLNFSYYDAQHQIVFQNPATINFERIIDLHHFVSYFLIIILGIVLWLIIGIIDIFIMIPSFVDITNIFIKNKWKIYSYYICIKKYDRWCDPIIIIDDILCLIEKAAFNVLYMNYPIEKVYPNRTMKKMMILLELCDLVIKFAFLYLVCDSAVYFKQFKENKILEFSWTVIPCIILGLIAIPSFFTLYINEEILNPGLTIKLIGHQWYWSLDYTDLFPYWYNLTTKTLDPDNYVIDSYMIPTEFLNISKNINLMQFRLLEVDEPLFLPIRLHIRLIITADDVLHSFAMPAMGLKIDAVPGRLNQLELFIKRPVYFLDNVVKYVELDMDLCPFKYMLLI